MAHRAALAALLALTASPAFADPPSPMFPDGAAPAAQAAPRAVHRPGHDWNRPDLADVLTGQPIGAALTLTGLPVAADGLPRRAGEPGADATLVRFEILAEDAVVLVVGADGVARPITPEVALFRGHLGADPEHRIVFAVSDAGVHGLIFGPGRETVSISSGPFAAAEGKRDMAGAVASLLADVPGTMPACGVTADDPRLQPNGPTRPAQAGEDGEGGDHGGGAAFGAPCRRVRVAVDTDWQFTGNLFGGNTAASAGYALSLMGAVSEIYQSHINVRLQVPFLRVWAADVDPYSAADMFQMLDQFRDHWNANMDAVPRDLAHLLSGDGLGGGVAYLNVICTPWWHYGVSANLGGSFPYPVIHNDHGNWDPFVTAHELGHNFGTLHTHDGYEPPIDGCGNGDCSVTPNGTIMSYCHGCPGGMSNIRLEFHPRVVDRMLEYIANDVTCSLALAGTGALPDSALTWATIPVRIDVLQNDQAVSCGTPILAWYEPTTAQGGAVLVVPPDASFPRARLEYTPPAGGSGTDTFLYGIVGGAVAQVSIELMPLRAPDGPAATLVGLPVRYYALSQPSMLPDFDALTPYLEGLVTWINYPSTGGNFAGSGRADEVGAVFEGYIQVPAPGLWTFFLESDDGSRLRIGDTTVVDNDGLHGMVERSGQIGLQAGRHSIRVEFFENFGGAGLIARWQGPGVSRQVIPAGTWLRAAPCPADLDGGGAVEFSDLLILLGAWGPCGAPCPADLDGSGTVDFSDLLMLLSDWGPC